jgi:predicted Holliday junction resolvase-like endonuclease
VTRKIDYGKVINGDLGDIKQDLRDFSKDNKEAHQHLHDRIDDVGKQITDIREKSISKTQAIIYTVLASAVVGLLVAFAARGFR